MELTMKKGFKISFAVIMTALIIAISCVSAFAATGNTVINDKIKANSGDTVTYTLKLGDCTEKLEGIQMYVFYSKTYLSVDESSLVFPNLDGVVKNANYTDGIAFNWTSVTNLADFKKSKTLMTVDFKVKRPGNTKITYFITEMYGKDMTYLKSYTLTSDIALNDKTVIKDEAPVLSDDANLNGKYQGSFTNYADGKGEKNGSGKNHVSVTGAGTKAVATGGPANVTTSGNSSTVTIIIILGIVAAVIAIIILVILRNHFAKGSEDKKE